MVEKVAYNGSGIADVTAKSASLQPTLRGFVPAKELFIQKSNSDMKANTYFKKRVGFEAVKQIQMDTISVVALMEDYAAFVAQNQCSTLRASLLAAVENYSEDAASRSNLTANRAKIKISTLRSVLLLIDELEQQPVA